MRSDALRRAAALSLAPLAAGALGLIVMARHGAANALLGVQIGALALGALLAPAVATLGLERRRAPVLVGAASAALLILVAALAGEGLLGVHRWIALGPIRLHASSLASPVILAVAAALAARGRAGWAFALLSAAQLIHALQPDAGQATALAVGGAALMAGTARSYGTARILVTAALFAGAVAAWTRIDPLAAVPIVEGIVALAGAWSRAVQVLAVALLAAIPIALALAARRAYARDPSASGARAALVAYLATTLLTPLFGNYPVPVMGFGASPILGAALCIGLVAAD